MQIQDVVRILYRWVFVGLGIGFLFGFAVISSLGLSARFGFSPSNGLTVIIVGGWVFLICWAVTGEILLRRAMRRYQDSNRTR